MMTREEMIELVDPAGTYRELFKKEKEEEARKAQAAAAAVEEAPPPKVVVPPPWRPFPVDLLPEACRKFITGTAANIGCDESFVALPLLSVLAGTIGNARTIRLKPGWDEPAILWTAIVGESGTMKTPAIDSVLAPLWKREEQAYRVYERERKEDGEMKHLQRLSNAAWVKDGGTKAPFVFDEPAPICRRGLVSDTTLEELAGVLHENPRGVTLVQDELSGWLANFEGLKSRRANTATDWLIPFGARTLIVERKGKTRPMLYVPKATMSLTGGIQPDVLRQSLQRMGNNGIGARLLIAHPPYQRRKWVQGEGLEALQAGLADLLDKLDGLVPKPEKVNALDAIMASFKAGEDSSPGDDEGPEDEPDNDPDADEEVGWAAPPANAGEFPLEARRVSEGERPRDADGRETSCGEGRAWRAPCSRGGLPHSLDAGGPASATRHVANVPHALPMSAEAQTEWIAFYEKHAREQEEMVGDLAAAWSKLEAYAARLALVIHVVRGVCGEADPEVVDVDSLRAGIALADWFGNETVRFYALFATSEHAEAIQRLIALIQRRNGEITVRQLVQSDRRFRGNYVRAEIVLSELVETGQGNWVFRPGPGRRGRWVFRLFGAYTPPAVRPRPIIEEPPEKKAPPVMQTVDL